MKTQDRMDQFRSDMELAGFPVITDYRGRNFYLGPCVRVDRDEEQDVIRATTLRLVSDQMGKNGLVLYPA